MVGCQMHGRRVGSWVVGVLASQDALMIGRWERWSLFQKLHSLVVRKDVKDTLSWRESGNDYFFVSSLYRSYTRASSDPFPWCII
ncbi:hypothetical protein CK203_101751 [Vitis vinifera]|uniref:Uncharacterized protein n=1 Tax=Vitis vinifera TaxID=29760 RepID=A0A438F8U0_VITVI|nr:hypothetical protein CK203_101751 [Vitis vinifera]